MSGKKKKRRYRISEWFEWNRGEQRGMLVMILLIVMTIFWRVMIITTHQKEYMEEGEWEKEVTAWLHNREEVARAKTSASFSHNKAEADQLFSFEPNSLDDEGWKKLGFTPGQIRSIRKYLNGGGAFRVKGDVAKMYVIDDEDFARIEPFILLPDELPTKNSENTNSWTTSNSWSENHNSQNQYQSSWSSANGLTNRKKENIILEINAADTIDMVKIRGIGPWLARKIVEQRKKLGGFYDLDQLLEIYRMTPEKLDTLRQFLTLDKSLMQVRNINEISEEELRLFPYISTSQAKALMAYREKHGPFSTEPDMKKCVAIDEKTYEKLVIYFDVR
jgi:competence protein ComEA